MSRLKTVDAETKQLRLELDAFVASRLKDKTYQLSDGEQRFFSKCQLQSSIANGYLTGAITSAAIFWSVLKKKQLAAVCLGVGGPLGVAFEYRKDHRMSCQGEFLKSRTFPLAVRARTALRPLYPNHAYLKALEDTDRDVMMTLPTVDLSLPREHAAPVTHVTPAQAPAHAPAPAAAGGSGSASDSTGAGELKADSGAVEIKASGGESKRGSGQPQQRQQHYRTRDEIAREAAHRHDHDQHHHSEDGSGAHDDTQGAHAHEHAGRHDVHVRDSTHGGQYDEHSGHGHHGHQGHGHSQSRSTGAGAGAGRSQQPSQQQHDAAGDRWGSQSHDGHDGAGSVADSHRGSVDAGFGFSGAGQDAPADAKVGRAPQPTLTGKWKKNEFGDEYFEPDH